MTLNDGTFTITGVPVGTYTVKAMMMGYKAIEKPGMAVNAGLATEVNFQLVEADRWAAPRKSSSRRRFRRST